MALSHSPQIVTSGLAFYYDMGNPQKSWQGAPTFNASLQNGQNDVNPWGGDGAPTALGIEPGMRFRGRKVAKFQTGTSGNCYLNGTAKLSPSINSTVWTSTFYFKRVDGAAISTVGMYLYVTSNTNVNTTVNVTSVEDGWYKAVYTRSGLVSGYPTLTGMFSLGAATQYYFADWQCENLSISTPWVTGTRTTNDALIDMTDNSEITANSSISYLNDNTFEFLPSNSNSTLTVPLSTSLNKLTGTINTWVYPRGYSSSNGIFVNRDNSIANALDWLWIGAWSSGSIFYFRLGNGGDCCSQDLTVSNWSSICPVNTWSNVCVTWQSGSFSRIYVNKNLIASRTITAIPNTNPSATGRIGLGHDAGGTGSWNGIIQNFSIFNRALSDVEIQQNFNALRGRYGI